MMGIGINGSGLRDYSPTGTIAMREMLARTTQDLDQRHRPEG
jgi:hypothetical protein